MQLDGKDDKYGFGFEILEMQKGTLIHHEGNTEGYDTLLQIVPETEYAWISITNRDFKNLNQTVEWAIQNVGRIKSLPSAPLDPYISDPQSFSALIGKYFQGLMNTMRSR